MRPIFYFKCHSKWQNTQAEIEAALGNKSIGGYLRRLIEDYNIIVRQRPILSKEGTLAIRYEIQDNFISFWFNYFDKTALSLK